MSVAKTQRQAAQKCQDALLEQASWKIKNQETMEVKRGSLPQQEGIFETGAMSPRIIRAHNH
jgi:hypothetical protein